jgi:protein-L-isoaspartate(D-aspartate) O-methyltransferase
MKINHYWLAACCLLAAGWGMTDDYTEARADLVAAVAQSVARSADYTGRAALGERVMAQIAAVPRHEFVPPDMVGNAYLNTALPITHGQTISQPLIVALMTDFLDTEPGDVVLEVGTGSGYQAAVLAGLVRHVYSIEIIEGLAENASATLARLDYGNVTVKAGDGYLGWPEHAPFDGIIVTAAAPHLPQPLIDQLKPGAKLVIPVDNDGGHQDLLVVEKSADGQTTSKSILPVRFVPLTGER